MHLKLIALALGLALPFSAAQADVTSDIKSGVPLQTTMKNAKAAKVPALVALEQGFAAVQAEQRPAIVAAAVQQYPEDAEAIVFAAIKQFGMDAVVATRAGLLGSNGVAVVQQAVITAALRTSPQKAGGIAQEAAANGVSEATVAAAGKKAGVPVATSKGTTSAQSAGFVLPPLNAPSAGSGGGTGGNSGS